MKHKLAAAIILVSFICLQNYAEDQKKLPEESYQFQFWVGDWEVFLPDGTYAGKNSIKSLYNGRVLEENWKGDGGYEGKSLNTYDTNRGEWTQVWMDNAGVVLNLKGGMEGDSMVMMGKRNTPKGNVIDKITWTPDDDGTVTQLWQTSPVGRKQWSTLFKGVYRKME